MTVPMAMGGPMAVGNEIVIGFWWILNMILAKEMILLHE